MRYIPRISESYLKDMVQQYPVITVTGPRQSGKTTLVQQVFSQKPYLNLEKPSVREFALEDPEGFLNQYPSGAILDEIQRTPHLLSYIQAIVDEQESQGLYILTGSHQFGLRDAINQSLAGRTALLRLLPFSLEELQFHKKKNMSLEKILYHGFYPRIHKDRLNPTQALGDYCETYLERDVRQGVKLKNLYLFQMFMRLTAGQIGQIMNYQSLADAIGVSQVTIKEWISILEASFVIFLLPPYHKNIRKRLIKRPKLYFYDVGLASYLLGIEKETHLRSHPLKGFLFEHLVITELFKYGLHRGRRAAFQFYRDSNGVEVDLLFQKGPHLLPVEIKSAETIHGKFSKDIALFEKIEPGLDLGKWVVYAGHTHQKRQGVDYFNYHRIAEFFQKFDPG